MQSTPIRLSVVVFGTVTALAAYGLGRTSASTTDEQPTSSKQGTKKVTPLTLPTTQPDSPLSTPESLKLQPLTAKTLTTKTLTTKTLTSKALTKPSKASSKPKQPAKTQLAPLSTIAPPSKIRRLSINEFPIDAVIASSLRPESKAQPAQAPKKPQVTQPISTPQPPSSIPSSPDTIPATAIDDTIYTLGAGDRVRVEIFNVPEYSREYQVLVNGIINLYIVGPVSVRGMTPLQAQAAIAAKYAAIVNQPRVDVTVIAARPLRVAIAGEVSRPGTYELKALENSTFPSLTQLIRQAGGITQAANPRKIKIQRRQQDSKPPLSIEADLWELTQTGDLRQDLTLRDGDTIVIPSDSSINLAESTQLAAANFAADSKKGLNITVVGEVMRPGPTVLAATSGGFPTLSQALQQAGGITALADIREVEVRRPTRSGTVQTTRLNLWQLLTSGDTSQDLVLQQGDTVIVPKAAALTAAEITQTGGSTFAPTAIRVNVVGEVQSPGAVQVPPNTPLNQALFAAGGFNRRADRRNVQLLRLNPDGTVSRQNISVDLARGVDEKGNPFLRNNDVIVVDRSGGAKLEDTLDRVGGFLGRILPLGLFFR